MIIHEIVLGNRFSFHQGQRSNIGRSDQLLLRDTLSSQDVLIHKVSWTSPEYTLWKLRFRSTDARRHKTNTMYYIPLDFIRSGGTLITRTSTRSQMRRLDTWFTETSLSFIYQWEGNFCNKKILISTTNYISKVYTVLQCDLWNTPLLHIKLWKLALFLLNTCTCMTVILILTVDIQNLIIPKNFIFNTSDFGQSINLLSIERLCTQKLSYN